MKHDWKSINYDRERRGKRWGATRHNSQIYVKYAPQWSPAMLNGKRQPFCVKSNT